MKNMAGKYIATTINKVGFVTLKMTVNGQRQRPAKYYLLIYINNFPLLR